MEQVRFGEGAGREENGTYVFGGKPMEFTKTERRILGALLERRGRFMKTEELLELLCEGKPETERITRGTVAAHIASIRRKVSAVYRLPFIETERNLGYRICL